MKEYAVSVIAGEDVQLDSLPVAKITHYPSENGSIKPYALAVICMSESKIVMRLSAFETQKSDDSVIGAVLYLYPEDESLFLERCATPSKVVAKVRTLTDNKLDLTPTLQRSDGEDLQGKYWGYDICFDRSELALLGRVAQLGDRQIRGNFFKIKSTEPRHYGSFSDTADMSGGECFSRENMARLNLVSY